MGPTTTTTKAKASLDLSGVEDALDATVGTVKARMAEMKKSGGSPGKQHVEKFARQAMNASTQEAIIEAAIKAICDAV